MKSMVWSLNSTTWPSTMNLVHQSPSHLGRGLEVPAERKLTQLLDVDVQVGKSGKLTPVAVLSQLVWLEPRCRARHCTISEK